MYFHDSCFLPVKMLELWWRRKPKALSLSYFCTFNDLVLLYTYFNHFWIPLLDPVLPGIFLFAVCLISPYIYIYIYWSHKVQRLWNSEYNSWHQHNTSSIQILVFEYMKQFYNILSSENLFLFKKQLPSLVPIESHDIVKYLYNANYSCRRVPKLWLAQY